MNTPSVITVDFATRQRGPAPLTVTHLPVLPQSTEAWWHCPDFCDGSCYGGETLSYGQRVDREHFKTTMLRTVVDLGRGDEVAIEVGVIARESASGGYLNPANVTLELPGEMAELSADDAEEYAHAVLAAVKLARQPLPATSHRPPSLPSLGGGRTSTPRESA